MPYTAALVAIVLGYTWIIDRFVEVRGVWRQLPTVLVLLVGVIHASRTREWGFAGRALRAASLWSLAFTLPAIAVLLYLGARWQTLHERPDPWLDLLYLTFWGGGQQFLLQTVVLHEARQRMPPAAAVIIASLIFASLHLPNPFLSIVTALGALAWCTIYLRAPNILPLALSHALLTLAVLHAFDAEFTGHLRTGWNYLRH